MAAEDDANLLQKHMAGSYHSLRLGIGVIGVALPFVLWLGGRYLDHEALRGSMSAYYYSPAMRNTFVGALITIGACLYMYKGFSTEENVALNAAGFFAVVVAMMPTTDGEGGPMLTTHRLAAVLFFLSISYVAVFRAADTLSLVRDARDARKLRGLYQTLGVAMVVFPLMAVVLGMSNAEVKKIVVFMVEAAGVLVFGTFWLVKSAELKATDAQRLALEGKLQAALPARVAKQSPGRLVQVWDDDAAVHDYKLSQVDGPRGVQGSK